MNLFGERSARVQKRTVLQVWPSVVFVAIFGSSWPREVSVFCHEGGIREYVEHICEAKTPLMPETLAITATKKGVTVDVALRWNADMSCPPPATSKRARWGAGEQYGPFGAK